MPRSETSPLLSTIDASLREKGWQSMTVGWLGWVYRFAMRLGDEATFFAERVTVGLGILTGICPEHVK